MTTGRINPDGKRYYPPLVEAQVNSIAPRIASHTLVNLYSFAPVRLWRTLMAIRAAAKTADIVHAQYGSFTALLACLGKRGKPLVISFGGSDLLGSAASGLKARLRNRITLAAGIFAAHAARALIVKSKNLLEALPPALRAKAVIIPNGVDTSRFRPRAQADCRQTLGWNPTAPYLIFTPSRANNVIVKNVTLAAQTAAEIKIELPGLAVEYVLDKSREEVSLMMNAADCLLLTSLHEGSPNVIKEAMACNLPVVTTPVGDVAERLNGVSPSSIAASWSSAELAKLSLEILKSRQRSNGSAVLENQGLSETAAAARIVSLYNQVLS